MPAYSWLLTDALDTSLTASKIKAMKKLGVPYTDAEVAGADAARDEQARKIAAELVSQGVRADDSLAGREIVAMIAYLQRLGTDIKVK